MAWAIVPEEQNAKTAEEQGCRSAHPPFRPFAIRPQPGAWRVLGALRAAFGHFVSRDYLLARVRPRRGEDADPKIVEVYLCHLRKALKDTPFTIESRRGAGRWRLICRDQDSGIRNQDLS
ncbi:MAG TPA: helix-turn-helix domain-containing protein [Stellaceae bacterium]|nr:helix-turn-helix domain-containing protein [Stellaceae bacterium]